MSDVEMGDDDIIFTGRVRRPQNRTSPRRRYLSTSVHDAMDLSRRWKIENLGA